jgi:hypothetical protein
VYGKIHFKVQTTFAIPLALSCNRRTDIDGLKPLDAFGDESTGRRQSGCDLLGSWGQDHDSRPVCIGVQIEGKQVILVMQLNLPEVQIVFYATSSSYPGISAL